jgi:protein-tyrosine phosphatase
MELYPIDDAETLFISPAIDDWSPVFARRISCVIDLEGEVDHGVPSVPGHILYVYFPIFDEDLPDLARLDAVCSLGTRLLESGQKVLSHCGMGFNRSALVAGMILVRRGLSGREAVARIRARRPGALFNETFEAYLQSL